MLQTSSRQVRRVFPWLATPPVLGSHLGLWGFWETGILEFWLAADTMDRFVAVRGERVNLG